MFKRIGIIVGTRPEAIKLVPVYLELKKQFPSVDLISTGQHFTMLEQIFDFFDIVPDVKLEVMTENQSLAALTAKLCETLQKCYEKNGYDLVMVQGDTTTAMVAGLVAFYNKIKVAHVEAGLRTYNKDSPFPEEINRQIIGRFADFHFAPTINATEALTKEGLGKAYTTGNTVIDSLQLCVRKIANNEHQYQEKFNLIEKYKKLVLVTGHRRENFGEGFEGICRSIKTLSELYPDFLFYYPVHLNPNVRTKVFSMLNGTPNIVLDAPLPYDALIYLMSKSYIILTDSGGIQEEGPSLNVPILIMRNTTERPEGIENGCAVLVGTNVEKIVSEFNRLVNDVALYKKMAEAENPYGDGTAARVIAEILYKESIKDIM